MTRERAFQDALVDYARLRNWRLAHFRPARTEKGWRTPMQGDAGFPDLVLLRAPRLVFAELKSDTGRLTPAQREWIDELARQRDAWDVLDPHPPVEVYVWRPGDWPRIEEVLR